MTITITGSEEVKTLLSDLPSVLFEDAKEAISKATINTQKRISDNFGTGSNQLKSRTGSLRRSLQTRVAGETLNTLTGRVYTNMIYAPLQEKGGTVKAIDKYMRVPGGPYLNIPLSANKTPAGVMRQSARDVFSAGGFIRRSNAGNYLVCRNDGTPMFVLKKQVYVPPRLGMLQAAEDEVPTLLNNLRNLRLES
jgi:hypothetical protein